MFEQSISPTRVDVTTAIVINGLFNNDNRFHLERSITFTPTVIATTHLRVLHPWQCWPTNKKEGYMVFPMIIPSNFYKVNGVVPSSTNVVANVGTEVESPTTQLCGTDFNIGDHFVHQSGYEHNLNLNTQEKHSFNAFNFNSGGSMSWDESTYEVCHQPTPVGNLA
ncbi:hypothetical protein PVK06_012118 [Gossypium arboreum]|uniref:Uncharacterized protein n=1 Tax=Gossypium arboreum TaxID=29729 RepID=A0ABR0QAI3_GOSAR|nr:hypothetical protein PVK06_012118 [Gossypium arboreum]